MSVHVFRRVQIYLGTILHKKWRSTPT